MEVSSDCNKMLFSAVFIKDASVQEIRFIQQKTLHKILSIKDILKPTGKWSVAYLNFCRIHKKSLTHISLNLAYNIILLGVAIQSKNTFKLRSPFIGDAQMMCVLKNAHMINIY